MDKQHKAAKVISGLVLLASILLLIDYYLPQQQLALVIERTTSDVEDLVSRRGLLSSNTHNYGYAQGIKIAESNFPCIKFLKGDAIILSRSAIYKLQTEIIGLNSYNNGEKCPSEYNPFAARGLFILLPILFAIGAIRSKDIGGSVVGGGVALVVYLADICSLFIL